MATEKEYDITLADITHPSGWSVVFDLEKHFDRAFANKIKGVSIPKIRHGLTPKGREVLKSLIGSYDGVHAMRLIGGIWCDDE